MGGSDFSQIVIFRVPPPGQGRATRAPSPPRSKRRQELLPVGAVWEAWRSSGSERRLRVQIVGLGPASSSSCLSLLVRTAQAGSASPGPWPARAPRLHQLRLRLCTEERVAAWRARWALAGPDRALRPVKLTEEALSLRMKCCSHWSTSVCVRCARSAGQKDDSGRGGSALVGSGRAMLEGARRRGTPHGCHPTRLGKRLL